MIGILSRFICGSRVWVRVRVVCICFVFGSYHFRFVFELVSRSYSVHIWFGSGIVFDSCFVSELNSEISDLLRLDLF